MHCHGVAAASWCLATVIVCALPTAEARVMRDSTLGLNELVWVPEQTGEFVGTPSVVTLGNGSYVAARNEFGPGGVPDRTHIVSSSDGGINWAPVVVVPRMYWANLFVHQGDVYLLGTTGDGISPGIDGGIAIARSRDAGSTWEHQIGFKQNLSRTLPEPVAPHATAQELFQAPPAAEGSYATGATPVLRSGGRLWRAFELWRTPHRWPQDFQAMLISAPEAGDLLDPSAWTATAPLAFNDAWIAGVQPATPLGGFLEGNAVEGPGGQIHVLLRVPLQNVGVAGIDLNHACLLTFEPLPAGPGAASAALGITSRGGGGGGSSGGGGGGLHAGRWAHGLGSKGVLRQLLAGGLAGSDETRAALQPARGGRRAQAQAGEGRLVFDSILDMPGGGNMFVVRRDAASALYVALTNPQTPDSAGCDQRNILDLLVSPDLRTWRTAARLLADDTGLAWQDSLRYTGGCWHTTPRPLLHSLRPAGDEQMLLYWLFESAWLEHRHCMQSPRPPPMSSALSSLAASVGCAGFHYTDWHFEGDDIIAVIRTSYRGANSYHNSNRMTFLRVAGWRQLLSGRQRQEGVVLDAKVLDARLLRQAANSFYWGGSCCERGGSCRTCTQGVE